MSPIECAQLADAPIPFGRCPKCDEPFYPFMRGQVQRSRFWFWYMPKRDYCALICRACKRIVGWESPSGSAPTGTPNE